MDSFNIQSIKIEKASALSKYRRLQKITTLFRFIELFAILIMLSRFSAQLPTVFNFNFFGECFRGLSVTLVSPRFVFVVGNAIVAILYLKSGRISSQDNPTISFCDDGFDNVKKNLILNREEGRNKQRKQSMREENKTKVDDKCCQKSRERMIRRSQSDKIQKFHRGGEIQENRRELRRSATESCRGTVYNHEQPSEKTSYAEDEMSSEEFRRKVEVFIARQQKFLRDEGFSAVVSFESGANR